MVNSLWFSINIHKYVCVNYDKNRVILFSASSFTIDLIIEKRAKSTGTCIWCINSVNSRSHKSGRPNQDSNLGDLNLYQPFWSSRTGYFAGTWLEIQGPRFKSWSGPPLFLPSSYTSTRKADRKGNYLKTIIFVRH